MAKNKKNVEYYLSLDYDVRIIRIEDGDEFGYKAYASELDDSAFYGVGKTKTEAVQSFEDVLEELIPYYWENDIPIPEPKRQSEDMPSGRFVVRTSPATHKRMIDMARENNQSLNSLFNALLEQYTTAEAIVRDSTSRITATVKAGIKSQVEEWTRDWNLHTVSPYQASEDEEHAEAANQAA